MCGCQPDIHICLPQKCFRDGGGRGQQSVMVRGRLRRGMRWHCTTPASIPAIRKFRVSVTAGQPVHWEVGRFGNDVPEMALNSIPFKAVSRSTVSWYLCSAPMNPAISQLLKLLSAKCELPIAYESAQPKPDCLQNVGGYECNNNAYEDHFNPFCNTLRAIALSAATQRSLIRRCCPRPRSIHPNDPKVQRSLNAGGP